MMAAATASSRGLKTILLEKNQLKEQVLLGKKLLITGNGRCNVTNKTDTKGLIANIPTNGRFLYSAFSRFSPSDTIDLLERYGVPVKVEDRGRVLPQSNRSKDVVNALRRHAEACGAEIRIGQVTSIKQDDSEGFTIFYQDATGKSIKVKSESLIIATGGKSYPQTGSTGDGYRFAEGLGHRVTPLKGSLLPLEIKECWVKDLQGLSLQSVHVVVQELMNQDVNEIEQTVKGKVVYSDSGDMLFTHYGVTGPVIFSASSNITTSAEKYRIVFDILPDYTERQLEKELLELLASNGKKQISNILQELLPKRLVPIILQLSEMPYDRQAHQITQDNRKEIIRNSKGLVLNINRLRPIDEATVTSGGIDIKEINPKSMESKIVSNLFFAGEILDVDGYTGGFNIQIALSTGFVAGDSC
ncbi:hypothetical protein BHF68_06290 [Desulfuribacillus alkaliarsenatis]|uniref:FAD-dependent oxidoreductase n=2 Tax=Desulfuribacillus alkaliarsenatis TaxID=766136 RepID=A0A1E5G1T1_9FIRM|nr:hypothetical protein BHF68_06290 [Desulfuribacillus alkaliarsenatis]